MHNKEDILADADVADLALVDHLLELLPCWVVVLGELLDVTRLTLLGDRPVDEVEVEVVGPELSERVVQGRFDVFGRVVGVPQLMTSGMGI